MTTKHATADQMLVRKLNTAIILDCLRLNAPLSRADLSNRTGLNPSTVSNIVSDLIEKRFVQETQRQKDRLGRPGMSLELDPKAGAAIGVELGVDFVTVLLADFVARPRWRMRVELDPAIGQGAFLEQAERLIHMALAQAHDQRLRPLGIGVGVPGLVDLEHGRLVLAPNLHWRDVSLRQRWTARFQMPVFVENDANAAALGEYYFGVAREVKHFLYLNAGVGLGGGIMIGGKLLRGSGGYAGEIGHITFDPYGLPCGCGKRGCWETVVGPRAVVRHIQTTLRQGSSSTLHEHVLEQITFAQVVEAALAEDSVALEALQQVAEALGVGIANLVNIFNPELIVLGGALAMAGSIVKPIVEITVRKQALESLQSNVRIVTSAHGSEACVVGTAALVLDDILRDPVP